MNTQPTTGNVRNIEPTNDTTAPQVFTFYFADSDAPIRSIVDEKGKPWFVAGDVAVALGYVNPKQTIQDHCKHAKLLKGIDSIPLTTSPRGITLIPEGDVYRLIMRSKLPSAEKFEAWVMDEVLPSLRKNNFYIDETRITGSQLKAIGEQLMRLEKQIAQDRPLVALADIRTDSWTQFGVQDAAKLAGCRTCDVSRLLVKAGIVKRYEFGNGALGNYTAVNGAIVQRFVYIAKI